MLLLLPPPPPPPPLPIPLLLRLLPFPLSLSPLVVGARLVTPCVIIPITPLQVLPRMEAAGGNAPLAEGHNYSITSATVSVSVRHSPTTPPRQGLRYPELPTRRNIHQGTRGTPRQTFHSVEGGWMDSEEGDGGLVRKELERK